MAPFRASDLEITPAEVRDLHARGEVELVDVREPYEWEAGHVAGARHIELERLASQAETLPKDRPVVFVCRLGARSAMAAQAFAGAGHEARTMVGGMEAWHAQGLPLDPPDGHVADH